ncbi:MAG: hypothetical protein ACYC0E_15320, partial [Acidimicrobiales bacterium]
MRKHRLYGFCLALATVAGVALQRPGTADAAPVTTGLPTTNSTTHHEEGANPAMPVDGLVGFRTPPRVTDAPRADAPRLARERRPLFRATRPTSGNGRFHVSIRDVVIEREAQNLTRLAAAVRFADAVALSELAHAVAVDRLAGAYQAFQAAAAAQRAQSAAAAVAAAPAPAP